MARLEHRTARGLLVVSGADEESCRAAAALAERALEAGETRESIDEVLVLGRRAWWKRGWLRGAARLRHARIAPREREHANLLWLRERLFRTPSPIASGVVRAHGLPCFQFLLTEDVAGATTLESFLGAAVASERDLVLDELAREVARMHALRFLHHDLYPRNVLVGPAATSGRVLFLDAWAGGPAPNLRGPAYDLACLLLRGEETLGAAGRARFLDLYVGEREAQERPVARARLEAAIRRERSALIARLERRPHELRGRALPAADG